MRVVRPNDPGYDADRRICNARFDYRPLAIYYCENAGDVSEVIRGARADGAGVRIRSGGHQHEGMCTANGVRLIDVSCINSYDYEGANVWIGAGASLTDIYGTLWHKGYLFSGGGCGDVHVGGLTQGGGWGPVSRKYGLTCDSLVGVEIVSAAGDIVVIRPDAEDGDRELLWALRGGGGGNFGVVTKFCFRLHPWNQVYTGVSLTWGDEQLPGDALERIVLRWAGTFPRDDDRDLTTFLRLSVVDQPGGDRLMIGGRHLGAEAEARAAMGRLLDGLPEPRQADYPPSPSRAAAPAVAGAIDADHVTRVGRTLATLPGYQPGPPTPGRAAAAPEADLGETCAGVPLRHKISSGFARRPFELTAVQNLIAFVRGTDPQRAARQYVSLHCLGGAIGDDVGGAFAFRSRDVLLQYQAWWQPDASGLDTQCIEWIENARSAMAPYTAGAFINFVDRDIPLPEYYGQSLPGLRVVKRRWDPESFFGFEMGIPPA